VSCLADDWRPTASPTAIRVRAESLARLRRFFAERDVLEVETPMLSQAAVSDVQLASVPAALAGLGTRWLQTSPEYPMKRLLAAGFPDIYQVARVFRDGERGRWHHPEFTLLEWYRHGFDHHALMDELDALLRVLAAGHRELGPAQKVSYRDAVLAALDFDPLAAEVTTIVAALAKRGIDVPGGLDRDGALDLAMSVVVGPALGRGAPCFVHGYPASQAALARIDADDPRIATRFELYLDGHELANGFWELADAVEQRARFEGDLAERRARGLPTAPLDERLLAALASGLPDCAGVAVGFDRLLACLTGADSLDAVIAFPIERA